MSEELIQTALRVLTCYTKLPRSEPDPADVAVLGAFAETDEWKWNADRLAIHIIEREIRRRRAKAAAC